VANWPDIPTAVADLQRFVNDGPLDRFVKEKIVVNPADGVNTTFLVWDERLIGSTLVVSLDFVPVLFSSITQPLDSNGINITGQFTLATPPPQGTGIRASYFFQFFLLAELQEALQMAAQELNETDDITLVASGLKLAALSFAGSFAYQRLAIRWAQKLSNRFLMIEEPQNNENMMRPNMFRQIAKDLWDQGVKLRDSFYMRHGRRNAPAFNRFYPRIPNVGPRP